MTASEGWPQDGPLIDMSPKYVGGYEIGGPMGMIFMMEKKPLWLHRKMARALLGFRWRNGTSLQKLEP